MNEMLLTDERMDVELGDVTGSFATPVPRAKARSKSGTRMGLGAGGLGEEVLGEEDGGEDGEDEDEGNVTVSPDEVVNRRGGDGDEQEDENDEKTVMFNKRLFPSLFPYKPPSHSLCISSSPSTLTKLRPCPTLTRRLPRLRDLDRPRRTPIAVVTFWYTNSSKNGRTPAAADGKREHAYEAWGKWEVENQDYERCGENYRAFHSSLVVSGGASDED